MALRYGNESQYTAFLPQCGFFVDHPAMHYVFAAYLPFVSVSAVILNAWIVYILVSGGPSNNKLLEQSQHVYVLGSAVSNVLWSFFGILGFWFDQFVLPCVYKGLFVCGFKNIFDLGGGYQLAFNVCLICYDRFRLVSLGVQYDQRKEVRRAKWRIFWAGMASFLLFIVPEIAVPLSTGNLFPINDPGDVGRCRPSQGQNVSWLGGFNALDILSIVLLVGPFLFIVTFTSLTTFKLLVMQRKSATLGTSQMADFRKLVRASFVMFGIVAAFMLAWFPYGFSLCMFEIDNDSIKWETIMVFIVLSDTAPLFDPFAFALTLPKLRARARQTKIGRLLVYVLTLATKKSNNKVVHFGEEHNANTWGSTLVQSMPFTRSTGFTTNVLVLQRRADTESTA